MKIAQFIYTPFAGHGNSSIIYRALRTAQELHEAGDEVQIVFDGAGTEALAAISQPGHDLYRIFEKVRSLIAGACAGCAQSYGVKEKLAEAGFTLLRDYRGEASMAKYIHDGYQVITY